MDKTIEEMSKQFADEMYSETMADDRWSKARYFYKKGANAVLGEIENLIKTTSGDGEAYHYNLYIGLVKLIDKLKNA